MGIIKYSNSRDLVDAKEIKKGWKEYMEGRYRKDLNEPDYYDGVISHPEPDILESKVKWALGSTAVNTGMKSLGLILRALRRCRQFLSRDGNLCQMPQKDNCQAQSDCQAQRPSCPND